MIKSLQLIALIACSHVLSAQMIYAPQTFSTPRGNITIQQPVGMMPRYYGGPADPYNPKFDFVVILKNDSVLNLKSSIETEEKKMFVVQKERKKERKIFPSETRELIGYSIKYGRYKGIPTDSCWLFRTYIGAIVSYAALPMNERDMVIAIQQGDDGAIVPLNKENLEAITGTDDPKIVKWLSRKKFSKVIVYYNEQYKKKETLK